MDMLKSAVPGAREEVYPMGISRSPTWYARASIRIFKGKSDRLTCRITILLEAFLAAAAFTAFNFISQSGLISSVIWVRSGTKRARSISKLSSRLTDRHHLLALRIHALPPHRLLRLRRHPRSDGELRILRTRADGLTQPRRVRFR